MRKLLLLCCLGCSLSSWAQNVEQPKVRPTLKLILLEQFKTTWNQQDWFVPVMKGLEGLTAKQAMWKPADSCHSIGELAYHLLFWNRQELDKFYNRQAAAYSGNNNETFTAFTEAAWTSTVQQLNQLMKDWEQAIEQADEAKLEKWYGVIAHISTHNAYHTGQILYIRKLAGNWDSAKGVK